MNTNESNESNVSVKTNNTNETTPQQFNKTMGNMQQTLVAFGSILQDLSKEIKQLSKQMK